MRARFDSIALPVVETGRRAAWSFAGSWPIEVDRGGTATITASATTHTKGAWTELIASTAAPVSVVALFLTGLAASGQSTGALLDIGVGGAGSETVVVPDIAIGGANNLSVTMPVFIPAGSRIAARMQAEISSDTVSAIPTTYRSSLTRQGAQVLQTYGSISGTSLATAMTSPAGTYVEITAATDRPLAGVVMVPSVTTNNTPSSSPTFTVALGPSGSEVDFGTIVGLYSASENIQYATSDKSSGIIPYPIPEGSRLAVKATSATASYGVCLVGIPVA